MKLSALFLWLAASVLSLVGTSCESSGSGGDEGRLVTPEYPKPKVTLAAAIETALKDLPLADCIGASLGAGEKDLTYLVTVATFVERSDFTIDPKSGAVIGTKEGVVDMDTSLMLRELAGHAQGVDTLKAIGVAQAAQSGYWALSAELVRSKDRSLVYLIGLVRGTKAKVASVSAMDGSVLSIEDASPER